MLQDDRWYCRYLQCLRSAFGRKATGYSYRPRISRIATIRRYDNREIQIAIQTKERYGEEISRALVPRLICGARKRYAHLHAAILNTVVDRRKQTNKTGSSSTKDGLRILRGTTNTRT